MNTETVTEKEKEVAALALLKSTGLGVLNAAQLVCAVVNRLRLCADGVTPGADETRGLGDIITRCEAIIDAGLHALAMRERTVSFAEAGWA
ncbi:MAG: hypothetical protein IKV92_02350, partial [Akkermansia sp.]|nr:hypothetical protein [Akkermansia sp.]